MCGSTSPGTSISGWECKGPTRDGPWVMWVPDTGKDGYKPTEEDRKRWAQQKKKEEIEAQKLRAEAMNPVDRNTHYKGLFDSLSLEPGHREKLLARGFSHERIDEIGFKSVVRSQPAPTAMPFNLPGISGTARAKRLTTVGDGWICPVRDVFGRIVAYQLRLDEPVKVRSRSGRIKDGGRYRWSSSSWRGKGRRPNRPLPTQALKNGENPLSVFRPASPVMGRVAVCEGLTAKPALLAESMGLITIGANGGQFSSSPKTLQRSLSALTKEFDLRPRVILFPDAGALKNEQVKHHDRSTVELIESLGYRVDVAYWGQGWEKSVGDIDELPQRRLDAISYKRPEEYFAQEQTAYDVARSSIRFLLENVALNAEEKALEKTRLATTSKLDPRIFDRLWSEVAAEYDRPELGALRQSLEDLQGETSRKPLKFSDMVPPHLAEPIQEKIRLLGGNDESGIFLMLPIVGALSHTSARLILRQRTGHMAKTNLWTAVESESGNGKSPIQKIFTAPLLRMQADAIATFQHRIDQFNQLPPSQKRGRRKPRAPRRLASDYTSEGLAEQMAAQPGKGICLDHEELASMVAMQDQYRGGKGADRQKALLAKDGSMLDPIRKGDSGDAVVFEASYSVIGGSQPKKRRKLMDGTETGDGFWPRFMWAIMPFGKRIIDEEDGPPIDTLRPLEAVYRRIDSYSPQRYRMSSQATALFRSWEGWLENSRAAEHNDVVRSALAKASTDTGAVALNLHIFNHSAIGATNDPPIEVGLREMANAIKISLYSLKNLRSFYSAQHLDDEVMAARALNELSQRGGGWVNARSAKQRIAEFKRDRQWTAEAIRELFVRLSDEGVGEIKGSGSKMEYRVLSARVESAGEFSLRDALKAAQQVPDTPRAAPPKPKQKAPAPGARNIGEKYSSSNIKESGEPPDSIAALRFLTPNDWETFIENNEPGQVFLAMGTHLTPAMAEKCLDEFPRDSDCYEYIRDYSENELRSRGENQDSATDNSRS